MPVESLDLTTPWPFTAVIAVGFLICAVTFLREPGRVKPLIPCVGFGFVLAMVYSENLHLDGEGVSHSGLTGARSLAWAEVRDARFEERRAKRGTHQTLVLIGRDGATLELRSVEGLGRSDAAVVADFLRRHLPGGLGVSVAARLNAMQRDDSNWQYSVSISPGA